MAPKLIIQSYLGNVFFQSQDLQHGHVGTEGHACTALLKRPEGRQRHAGPLSHLLGSDLATLAREHQTLSELLEQSIRCG
ncbi:hypothetical protein D3C80_1613460 [compost metagenome]